jgi:hypothetical protein
MSTITIITALIIMLATLVCYAFIYQTVQHRREKRTRLLAALKARAQTFKFILNNCPEGFLPKELTILVQRGMIEVLGQLSRLETKDRTYGPELQVLNAAMAETQRQTRPPKAISLQNVQQIKDVRACLEELHRFIFQQESRQALARNQAEAYRNQIRQLVLQITVDGYTLSGRAAKQKGKTKLALHYYELALNLLIREQRGGNQQKSIEQLSAITDELKKQLANEESESPQKLEDSTKTAQEWDKFADKDSMWKKKNIYD